MIGFIIKKGLTISFLLIGRGGLGTVEEYMINKIWDDTNKEELYFPDGLYYDLYSEVTQQLYAESMGWA